jgi:AraC-like DNA-binding protein
MDVPSYYARSWHDWGNRFWRCPPASFLHSLPLVIYYSGIARWTAGERFERRKSDVFSVEVVTAGNAHFVQDGREHIVEAGQVFLVHKGMASVFGAGPAGFVHKRAAVIDGITLDLVLRSLGLTDDTIVLSDCRPLVRLMKRANRLMGELGADTPWCLSRLANDILLELGRHRLTARLPAGVQRAVEYMNNNLNASLTLAEVARKAGMSPCHFSRQFSRSMAVSPMAFFHEQKMTFAKSLLRNTTLLVKEIAVLLGYDDPFYFTAQFSRHVGMPPREYRRSSADWGTRSRGMRK